MLRIRAIVPALCALAIAACGGSSGGGSTDPTGVNNGPTNNPPTNNPVTTNAVTVTADSFTPTSLTIAKGTSVTWTWDSCSSDPYGYGGMTCVAHNIMFDSGTTSGTQSAGTFTHQFDATGTFKYHCTIHGAAMSGEVVVQ